jgi:hypothetical protein
MTMPNSRSSPRTVFNREVRVASQVVRRRCSEAIVCCATDFTGTGRISSFRAAPSSAFRIAAVGLVSPHVAMHVVRRQQADGVAEALDLARPLMRAATGFEQHRGRRLLRKERQEPIAGQPALDAHLPGCGETAT